MTDAKRRAVALLVAELEAHNWRRAADWMREGQSMDGLAIAAIAIEKLLLRQDEAMQGWCVTCDCLRLVYPQPRNAAASEAKVRELLAAELEAEGYPSMAEQIRDESGYNTLGLTMVRVITSVLAAADKRP